MVGKMLVSKDIAAGRSVIEAPDEAGFPVDAAFHAEDTRLYRTAA